MKRGGYWAPIKEYWLIIQNITEPDNPLEYINVNKDKYYSTNIGQTYYP